VIVDAMIPACRELFIKIAVPNKRMAKKLDEFPEIYIPASAGAFPTLQIWQHQVKGVAKKMELYDKEVYEYNNHQYPEWGHFAGLIQTKQSSYVTSSMTPLELAILRVSLWLNTSGLPIIKEDSKRKFQLFGLIVSTLEARIVLAMKMFLINR
jgi:hypothetical protein